MPEPLRKEIIPDVYLTCVRTPKFKTGFLTVTLLLPLDKKTATENALMVRVLSRGTARYPDMEKLAVRLEELYGASIDIYVRKKGEIQCIGFVSRFLDNKYVPDGTDVLSEISHLMGEMLLDPATSGGRLRQDYVESERANLIDRINAQVNDKRSYAAKRLNETMCEGEKYGVSALGDVSSAERITAGKLTRHYRKTLGEAGVELFYCGNEPFDRVELALVEALRALPRTSSEARPATEVLVAPPKGEARYVSEEMDVVQGKLAVGFRLGECMLAPNYAAISVFNAVYGGCLTSKLFKNVRERLSLCYYASSGTEKHKGLLTVNSGIETDKYQQALDEILAQLEACRRGEITQEELKDAKSAVITSLNTVTDSQGRMEDFYLGQAIEGLEYGPEELAMLCDRVGPADVKRVAESLRLDTVYFLKGSGKEDAENEA